MEKNDIYDIPTICIHIYTCVYGVTWVCDIFTQFLSPPYPAAPAVPVRVPETYIRIHSKHIYVIYDIVYDVYSWYMVPST